MALVERKTREGLIVANTSNVKEMKNGRPMNVKLEGEGLENCVIVTLAEQPVDQGENDHVFVGTVLDAAGVAAKIAAGEVEEMYLVVAPEIMVEEARMTDGHIGLFRFEKGGVYTAYQLHAHDRIEVSSTHRYASGAGKEISRRPMANGLIIAPDGQLYEGSKLEMIKIEF